jgi:hypothetical protein
MKNTSGIKAILRIAVITALVAVVGFSMAAWADGGGGGGDGLNGVWVTGEGADQEELTLSNGSWNVKTGNILTAKGTYETSDRSISKSISFETTHVHADFLKTKYTNTFESKWHSRDDLEELGATNAQIEGLLPSFEGTYDGTNLNIGGDDYTKKSGGNNKPSGGNGGNIAPATSGSLTITGLSSYNGKYIGGTSLEEVSGYMLLAYDGFSGTSDNAVIHLKQITNGSATLKVWRGNDKGVFSYTGSASAVPFMLYIFNSPDMDEDKTSDPMSMMGEFVDVAMPTIRFSSGKGTIKWEGLMGGLFD